MYIEYDSYFTRVGNIFTCEYKYIWYSKILNLDSVSLWHTLYTNENMFSATLKVIIHREMSDTSLERPFFPLEHERK